MTLPFCFLFNEAGECWQSVAKGVLPEFLILDTENKDVAANAAMACFVLEWLITNYSGTLTLCFWG